MASSTAISARLKERAREFGFALSGIAPATETDGFARYSGWLDAGFAGEMQYLHDHREHRRHPRSVLENVRSVLVLGMEYGPDSGDARPANSGRLARYARGPDYHRFVWDRLNALADWVQTEVPGCSAQGVCDTAPLLERDFARRAGLGWVGKNAMLIDPRRGSYFFLAALLVDLDLEPDAPFANNHCGTCTACLDACPTNAFPEPGVVDARRCVSYLTIELRKPIPEEFRPGVGDWLWGCDVCQEVCPWNRFSGREVAFPSDSGLATLDAIELLGLSDVEFRRRFRGTPIFRGRRTNLLRNAALVLGNTGDATAIPALEASARDEDEIIADAARWAIERIREREGRAK